MFASSSLFAEGGTSTSPLGKNGWTIPHFDSCISIDLSKKPVMLIFCKSYNLITIDIEISQAHSPANGDARGHLWVKTNPLHGLGKLKGLSHAWYKTSTSTEANPSNRNNSGTNQVTRSGKHQSSGCIMKRMYGITTTPTEVPA